MTVRAISILGCGWLGHPLGAHLAQQGYRVKGSTTTPEKLKFLRADGVKPYLLRLDPEVKGEEIDDFFEADLLFLNVPPPQGHDNLRSYHLQQIKAVREAVDRSPISWVIFASSTGVYPALNRVVTERDAPGDPAAAHGPIRETGEVLLDAERLLQEAEAFDTTIVRFAGLYGGDRQPGRFLAGRSNVGGGDAPVNLIHREDCIGVVVAIIEQDVRNEVFNACADAHPPRRELYTHAAERLGLDPPTFSDDGTPYKVVSNEKVKRQLGYRFRHPSPLE